MDPATTSGAFPSAGPAGDAAVSELRWSCRASAAVLSWFDPQALVPHGGREAPGVAAAQLADDALSPPRSGHPTRWILRADVRRAALRRLGTRERMQAAQADTPVRCDDPLQHALDACIAGTALMLPDELEPARAAVQVVEWLTGTLDGLPDLAVLRGRVAHLELLQPLRHLVGRDFQGRTAELRKIADYAGVGETPHARVGAALSRFARGEVRPLLVCGVGGIGKSTLLAAFLLRHAATPEAPGLAFARIDFDRPGLAESPAVVLQEVARQIGVLCPQAAAASAAYRRSPADAVDARGLDEFAALVDLATPRGRRFVLVLDTVEELQYAGAIAVDTLWQVLDGLRERLPRLRVLLASRVPLEGRAVDVLALDALDPAAATALLIALGLPAAPAAQIHAAVGGIPLAVRLAAEYAMRAGPDTVLRDLGDGRGLRARVGESVVQALLFRRIMSHIHDEQVRRLVPGILVLRRITPQAILQVLAGTCGLNVTDPQEAQRLFEGLRREIALVAEEAPSALRLRPDLRKVLLPLLRMDDPALVERIHRAAVAFLQRNDDIGARADEIYHRLALDEDAANIDARWRPGVELHLADAIDELPARAAQHLARRLGIAWHD
jgi:hypothetical protein